MLFAVTRYSVCFCLCYQRFWAWGRGHPPPILTSFATRHISVILGHPRAVLDPALWSLLWYNPFAPAQLLLLTPRSPQWLGWVVTTGQGECWGQGSSVGNLLLESLNAVSSIAFPHMHSFLPCFNTNSLTLQTSVYQVVTALKCDYSSQIQLSEASCQALPRWVQTLNIQTCDQAVAKACCVLTSLIMCQGMSREMSSGQNLQSFPHSSTALITHLENEIQFLDRADCFPRHRNLVSKNICKASTCFCQWPLHRKNHWIVDQVLMRPCYYGILKIKQPSYFPCIQEAREFSNLSECLPHSQAVPCLTSEMLTS